MGRREEVDARELEAAAGVDADRVVIHFQGPGELRRYVAWLSPAEALSLSARLRVAAHRFCQCPERGGHAHEPACPLYAAVSP